MTEARLPVELDGGATVEALAYVSNPAHAQYCGGLSLEAQAEVIARAVGPKGRTPTTSSTPSTSLEALGLHDPDLARLAEMVRGRARPEPRSPFRAGAGVTCPRPPPYRMAPQQRR